MTNKYTPWMMEDQLHRDEVRKPRSSQVRTTALTSWLLAGTMSWLGMATVANAQTCPEGTVFERYENESTLVLEIAGSNRIVPLEVKANVFGSYDTFPLIAIPSEDGTKLFIANTFMEYLKVGYSVRVDSADGVPLCDVKKDDFTLVPGALPPQPGPGGGGGGGGGPSFLPGGGNGSGLFPLGYTGYTPCGTATITDAYGNPVDQYNPYGGCDPFGSPWPVYDFSNDPWFGFDLASMFLH